MNTEDFNTYDLGVNFDPNLQMNDIPMDWDYWYASFNDEPNFMY